MAEVNYTEAQVNEAVARYEAANTDVARAEVVEQLAKEFGKTKASVRAKLVREGVYVAKTVTRKRKAKKADVVALIAKVLGVNEEVVGSLENATYATLVRVYGALGARKAEAE